MLANYARKAAKQYRSVSDEEKRIALRAEGRLAFTLMLWSEYKGSLTFGKDYHAVLLYKDKYIQPVFKRNPELAEWDKTASKYSGFFLYEFPLESVVDEEQVIIDPDGKVTLIAISPQGKETRFEFDLSKVR